MVTKKRAAARTSVEDVRHADTRLNIPTEELREFVTDEEALETLLSSNDEPALTSTRPACRPLR